MKKLLFFLSIVLMKHLSSQTWVTIPDANFATYLQSVVPGAMNGNQMDISNPAVTTTTHSISLAGFSPPVSNLSGVQYFTSLTFLDCSNTYINNSGLPSNLPNTLIYLNCSGEVSFSSLPILPNSIKTLICSNNQITSLSNLPSSLTYLDCQINDITSIASLPNSLQYLRCNSNQLTSLPVLPKNLKYLYCYLNSITNLPSLDSTLLQEIYCSNNAITSIPVTPNSLKLLDCSSNNLITNISTLSDSLIGLYCGFNSLTNLPTLPSSLKSLNCNHNSLTNLPVLPDSLQELFCESNNITCFPTFPNTILPSPSVGTYYFIIDPNPYNCLPNHIAAMPSNDMTVPLCTTGNTNGCAIASISKTMGLNNQVQIYPNPSTGLFNLKIDQGIKSKRNININIYDNNGRLVENVPFTQVDDYTLQINLTNYGQGLYLIKAEIDNVLYSAKLGR